MPIHKLKKAFHDKFMEYNKFNKEKKLDQFDASNLHTKRLQEEILQDKIDLNSVDQNIQLFSKIPKGLRKIMLPKYNISSKDFIINLEKQKKN